jgi:ArsR family transcriptional regulator
MSNNGNDIERRARLFKALSNPHRLALFQRLMSCCAPGTVCSAEAAARYSVGTLGQGLGIAPSTLSHHLKELSQAGLVQTRRCGKQVECWVEPDVLNELAVFFTPPMSNNEESRA